MKGLSVGNVGKRIFRLPVDVAGEAIAILAKRGAGKTNTATVIVEEMFVAGVQVVILDPVGAWWGVRSSADGKSPGLSIPILGGQHGDVPLEETAGGLIADVVVDTGSSALLDLSDFESKAAMNRFATAFAKRLYYRKGRSPSSLHVVLEEADQFCPQGKGRGEEQLVGAFERMVRLGRSRGIGVTMVTQRSAKLNKDILTQADWLVAMRTTGPNDKRAIKLWIDNRPEEAEVMKSLPDLKPGEAWFWGTDVLHRVQVRIRETFDSSSTPKVGELRAEPTAPAPIDLESLGKQIADTVEKVKANDPAALKRELAKANREIQRLERATPAPDPEQLERAEDRGRRAAERHFSAVAKALDSKNKAIARNATKIEKAAATIGEAAAAIAELCKNGDGGTAPKLTRDSRPARSRSERKPARRAPATTRRAPVPLESEHDLTGPQRKILGALAQLDALGFSCPSNKQVATFARYTASGGSYNTYLSRLSTGGLIARQSGHIELTDAGRSAIGDAEVPITLDELHRQWMEALPGNPHRKLLAVILENYPEETHNEDLAEEAGYTASGGSFNTYLSKLSSLGLVDRRSGYVRAAEVLFPPGLD